MSQAKPCTIRLGMGSMLQEAAEQPLDEPQDERQQDGGDDAPQGGQLVRVSRASHHDAQRPTPDPCRALRAMKSREFYACWAPGYAGTASVRERPRLSS